MDRATLTERVTQNSEPDVRLAGGLDQGRRWFLQAMLGIQDQPSPLSRLAR